MYRPISDYAIIGDTHTAALVNSQGCVDWLCWPHFNSPALFLRLLDDVKGGYCAIQASNLLKVTRHYRDGQNILETIFHTTTGVLVTTDFMPIAKRKELHPPGQDVKSKHKMVRLICCESGFIECLIEIKPTFRFAAERATVSSPQHGTVVFQSKDGALQVHSPTHFPLISEESKVSLSIRLRQGEVFPLLLSYVNANQTSSVHNAYVIQRELEETANSWAQWSRGCSYDGEHREMVLRSALTLKMLTFEPTGAIVAAPTTSLPEEIGGVRNWDYRFTWLRDASFTLAALMNLGYFDEAHDFMHFLKSVCDCPAINIQPLYGTHGGREEPEQMLSHLDGYCGSKPVRIGNAAVEQRQLDIYGELLNSIHLYTRQGGFERYNESFLTEFWPIVQRVANHVVRHWKDPDRGIWEVRTEDKHFIHSKARCPGSH